MRGRVARWDLCGFIAAYPAHSRWHEPCFAAALATIVAKRVHEFRLPSAKSCPLQQLILSSLALPVFRLRSLVVATPRVRRWARLTPRTLITLWSYTARARRTLVWSPQLRQRETRSARSLRALLSTIASSPSWGRPCKDEWPASRSSRVTAWRRARCS